jgi:hypothetical protein
LPAHGHEIFSLIPGGDEIKRKNWRKVCKLSKAKSQAGISGLKLQRKILTETEKIHCRRK